MEVDINEHEGQKEVLESDAETRVVVKGRQWGGSTLIAEDVVDTALEESDLTALVITPSWLMADNVIKLIFGRLHRTPAEKHRRYGIRIENGSTIEFLSAKGGALDALETPPDYIAVEEADMITPGVMRTAESSDQFRNADQKLYVGTPFGVAEEVEEKGHTGSWLYEKFIDGLLVGTDTESWQFSTLEAPQVTEEEIEEMQGQMPDDRAEQSFGARWGEKDE